MTTCSAALRAGRAKGAPLPGGHGHDAGVRFWSWRKGPHMMAVHQVKLTFPDDALSARDRARLRTRLAGRIGGENVSWSTVQGHRPVLRVWVRAASERAAEHDVLQHVTLLSGEARAADARIVATPWSGLMPTASVSFYDGSSVARRHGDLIGEAQLDGVLLTCPGCGSDCGWVVDGAGTRASDFVYRCEHCDSPATWPPAPASSAG